MKKIIITIIFCFGIVVLAINTKQELGCKEHEFQNINTDFIESIDSIDDLKFPLIINGNNFELYNESIFNNKRNIYQLNTKFKIIPVGELKSLDGKIKLENNFTYQLLYKMKRGQFNLVVLKQNNHINQEYLFILISCNNRGECIDTCTIAGFKANYYDIYCLLKSKDSIEISTIMEEPGQDSERLKCHYIFKKIAVEHSGIFKQVTKEEGVKFFKYIDNIYVPIDQ